MSLDSLPFPLEDLAWDKLKDVQKSLKISKNDAISLMAKVLGPRLPASWLQHRWSNMAQHRRCAHHMAQHIFAQDMSALSQDPNRKDDDDEDEKPKKAPKGKAAVKPKSKPKAKGQPKSKAKAKAKTKTVKKSAVKSKAKPKAKAKTKAGAKAKTKKLPEPEPAEDSDLEEQGEEEESEEDQEVAPEEGVTRKRKEPIVAPAVQFPSKKTKAEEPQTPVDEPEAPPAQVQKLPEATPAQSSQAPPSVAPTARDATTVGYAPGTPSILAPEVQPEPSLALDRQTTAWLLAWSVCFFC